MEIRNSFCGQVAERGESMGGRTQVHKNFFVNRVRACGGFIRRWRRVLAGSVLGSAIAIPLGLYADSAQNEFGLNQFAPHTVISSSEVNENFYALGEHVDRYEDAIYVDDNRKVGIGTMSPGALLEVRGTAPELRIRQETVSYAQLSLTNSSGVNTAYFRADHAGLNTVTLMSGSGPLVFGANNSEAVRIDSTGNVGIGTTSPGYSLHILRPNNTAVAVLEDTAANSNPEIFIKNDAVTWQLVNQGTNSDSFAIRQGGANKVTVTTDGRVGIGTVEPIGKLDVIATPTNPLTISSVVPALYFHDNEQGGDQGANDDNRYASFMIEVDGSRFYIGSKDRADSNTPASGSRQFTILSNGYVGIGTTNPQAMLHVAGTIIEDSDIRLKKNIVPVDNALDRLMAINGVSYEWKDPDKERGSQLGVVAQDVEVAFPELVRTDPRGYKSVNYNGLVAPMIEAIKEQQSLISEQEQVIVDQRQALGELQRRVGLQQEELAAVNDRLARLEALLDVAQ